MPGAGTYKLAGSCNVKQSRHTHASMRSTVKKGLDQVIGKDNPGIGEYDTQHLRTIANKEFQGGASNNFVLFTRKNYQVRQPVIPEVPRLAKLQETTPRAVGPGTYLSKKNRNRNASLNSQRTLTDNLHFGKDGRFKMDTQKATVPGPGAYTNDNSWTRRTYNLKFLNFNGVRNDMGLETGRSRSLNNTIDMAGMGGSEIMSINNKN